MALIKCTECGNEVSDKAQCCPKCGCLLEKMKFNIKQEATENLVQPKVKNKKPDSILGIAGLICSLLFCIPIFPFIGLIFCGAGLMQNNYRLRYPIIGLCTSVLTSALVIIFLLFGNIEEKENNVSVPDQNSISTPIPTEAPTTEPISQKEIFSSSMVEASELINIDTANSLYDFLLNDCLFENIEFKEKSSVGDILFIIYADGYSLKVSVDNDGIYSIRCGSFELYNGSEVFMTKIDLKNRDVDHMIEYYIMAQDIVTQSLNYPLTADFPFSASSNETYIGRNKDLIVVQSYVDAKNAFGVDIRSKFTVQFKVIDVDTFNYSVVYVNIDGQEIGEYIDLATY